MVELNPVAIDEANGRVRTECRDRELLQEILSNLQICVLLQLRVRTSPLDSRPGLRVQNHDITLMLFHSYFYYDFIPR